MADPTTANTSMSVPIRGTDVGTWDVPVNGNFNIIDSMFGGITTLAPTNAPITLTSAQAQASIIRLTGTLTGFVAITMANINKFWSIDNQLTNSPSSFAVTFVSTSGASLIGAPPGVQDIFYDGTTLNYRNLGKIGEYWDYVDAAIPNWVFNCTKPPYLVCDGTTFSSAVYPVLRNILGSNTLPDARGRYRATLNAGTGRITSSAGVDGNTLLASGGSMGGTIGSSNLPASIPYKDPGHTHAGSNVQAFNTNTGTAGGAITVPTAGAGSITTVGVGITVNPSTAAAGTGNSFTNISPTYIGGITMIRAG